ncbi:MAG: hypothetical protein U1E76_12650 [Planctomycetota bacterium]
MRLIAIAIGMSFSLVAEDRLRALYPAMPTPDLALPFVLLFGLHCERPTRLSLVSLLALLRAVLTREPVGRDLLLMLLATEGLARARRLLFIGSFANLLVLSSLTALWFVCGRTVFIGVIDGQSVDVSLALGAAGCAAVVSPFLVRLVVWSRALGALVEDWS